MSRISRIAMILAQAGITSKMFLDGVGYGYKPPHHPAKPKNRATTAAAFKRAAKKRKNIRKHK